MYSIPDVTSAEEVYNLLNEIEKTEEPEIQDWVEYYKCPYVLSSLNKHISKMNIKIWNRSSNNTNYAEALHANSNKDEKNLKLLTAIKYITHDNTGVSYTRRDRSKKSVECPKSTQKEAKGKQSEKKVVIDLSINASSSKITKRKEAFSGSKI
ncbi:unnamed protein product [Rhizophagus irregularis]|nr:unnamed protein product [Rhizophagus irregularis]